MRFVGRPVCTFVVYSLSLYLFIFDHSYAGEYSKSDSISISESESFESLSDGVETVDKDEKSFHSPLMTIRGNKGKLFLGSLYLCMAIAASIALYLMVPKMAKVKQREETVSIEGFDELEKELLEWFTNDPLLKDKASIESFQSDFEHFKYKEYSIIFAELQDISLLPKYDMIVRKFKQDFWNDYEKVLRPYFYYNQLQIGRFIFLAVESAFFGAFNYNGKSFFDFERGMTGRLNFDYRRCRKAFDEYKPSMSKVEIDGFERAIKMISTYEIYYNRVMDYMEKYCSKIEERRHLALKPNHEILAVLQKQNDMAP